MGSENAIQDTYYIYPSFKKTLAFLAQKGCAVNQTIDNLDISSIGVEGYDGNTGENIINGNMDIQVNYKNKNGENSIYCYSICTDDELQQLLKE